MAAASLLLLLLSSISISSSSSSSSQTSCRSTCGPLPIHYPLSIDDGCGSPLYRDLLFCKPNPSNDSSPTLLLRTPSGSYPILSLSYSNQDSHLVISDPSMWTCDSHSPAPLTPFSLDTSTRFSLSSKNSFLFLNCSPDSVIIEPRPAFCDRSPERCGSSCNSDSYLCRNLPGCPNLLGESSTTCCSFYPTAVESVRRMLRFCAGYAGVYWRTNGGGGGDEVAEYGIRVDFEVPSAAKCRTCAEKGKGVCGFDTATGDFLCLCTGGVSTTNCEGEKEKLFTIINLFKLCLGQFL
ncbi:wall-associated receptor kinase-like 20, partial [Phalaenopsis equestris]|uniref:wall-associated receptor kinase-like 20 n=1 Tax=Phalaenopsis equestris TaxID=78828 RepID=UPI0009E35578